MNLLSGGEHAGYVVAGTWGKKALANASKAADAYSAYDGSSNSFTRMPDPEEITVRPGSRYLHITSNETIAGSRMVVFPETDTPLVADMSSDFLARPIDWNRYDLIYGGVQKNLAPAGMALVFARRSVIERSDTGLGDYLRYGFHADSDSLGNTPPMFSIYLMGKVLRMLDQQGGVEGLERRSVEKAGLLYEAIDRSNGYYRCPVEPRDRSHMNVVFRLPSEDLEKQFVAESAEAGLIGLKGHRSVGGCRASLYAALERSSVERLVDFMGDFAASRR
jgi:phosphoserine aminotransferase